MKKKLSKICAMCKKPYECCATSQSFNSWRTNFCSPDCFQDYLAAKERAKMKDSPAPEEVVEETEVIPKKKRKAKIVAQEEE